MTVIPIFIRSRRGKPSPQQDKREDEACFMVMGSIVVFAVILGGLAVLATWLEGVLR